MAARSSLTSASVRSRIRRGILLSLLVGPVVAALFALIYGLSPDLWPLALVVVSPLGIGLLSGLGARAAFPGRRVLGWTIALSSSCLGLVLLGWLTAGTMGLNPSALPSQRIAWGGLFEIVMSAGGAWLSIYAWKRQAREAELLAPPAPTPAPAARPVVPSFPETPARRTRAFPLGQTLNRWRRRLERPRQRVHLPSLAGRIPRRRPRHLGVRIGRIAEERCPYCLDVIHAGDVRGVRRCEVCHTAHHADCWAQTGTCQVLHHHG